MSDLKLYTYPYIWGACGLVDRALDSRSKNLGFDSHSWSYVEVEQSVELTGYLDNKHIYSYIYLYFSNV